MTVAIEEKLRDLGSKVEAEPFALKPLGRAGRRRLFGRRMVVGGVAAAVLVGVIGGVVLGAGIRRGERETITPSERLESYRDPGYGWEMSYPSSWHLQPIDVCQGRGYCTRGALVSNFDRAPGCDNCYTPAWDIANRPSDFVSVQFAWTCCALPMARSDHPDTEFPLALDSRADVAVKDLSSFRRGVWVDGQLRFVLSVWIGADAPEESIRAADAIVGSMTKPVHAGQYPLGVGEASEPVGDQQASVKARVEPAIFSEGDAPRLVLENTGPLGLFYSQAFKLELKEPSGRWRHMNDEQAFLRPLFYLSQGEIYDAGRLIVSAGALPLELSAGLYRITKSFGVEGSDERLTVRALFLVVDGSP